MKGTAKKKPTLVPPDEVKIELTMTRKEATALRYVLARAIGSGSILAPYYGTQQNGFTFYQDDTNDVLINLRNAIPEVKNDR